MNSRVTFSYISTEIKLTLPFICYLKVHYDNWQRTVSEMNIDRNVIVSVNWIVKACYFCVREQWKNNKIKPNMLSMIFFLGTKYNEL